MYAFSQEVASFAFIAYIYINQINLMGNFKIRAYGLQELAMLYFPNSTPQSASNQLKKWMNKEKLLARLKDAGYAAGQKILTPRQVELIVGHVGEP